MKPDNPILNGRLYKKLEAAERLDEITPFTTGRVQRTLKIGHGQAAQIVDLFIQLGIVSICDKDGKRHALVSPVEAAIRVLRYLCREFETSEEEEIRTSPVLLQVDAEDVDLSEIFINSDSGDDTDCFDDGVLTDMPFSRLSRKELLRKAAEVICSRERIGTSSLQRYLGLGYGRAAGLMDTLEQLGIVGPDLGDRGGREVLLSLEESLARIEACPDEET